jgi:hypothetical protein
LSTVARSIPAAALAADDRIVRSANAQTLLQSPYVTMLRSAYGQQRASLDAQVPSYVLTALDDLVRALDWWTDHRAALDAGVTHGTA